MEDQAKAVIRMVQEDAEHETRMDAEARVTAHALIQSYIGPDHKVIAMSNFYSALVQALKEAREQGHDDCRGRVQSL